MNQFTYLLHIWCRRSLIDAVLIVLIGLVQACGISSVLAGKIKQSVMLPLIYSNKSKVKHLVYAH